MRNIKSIYLFISPPYWYKEIQVSTFCCLLLLWCSGVLCKCMVDQVLGYIDCICVVTVQHKSVLFDPIVTQILLRPRKPLQALPAVMYSASTVDKEMKFSFLLFQETRLFPMQKHPLVVLFWSSLLPAQSAPQ